jgi:hypothetical protein
MNSGVLPFTASGIVPSTIAIAAVADGAETRCDSEQGECFV